MSTAPDAPSVPQALVALDDSLLTLHTQHPIDTTLYNAYIAKRNQLYALLPPASDTTTAADLIRNRVKHQCCVLAWELAGRSSTYNPRQWANHPAWHITYNIFGAALCDANPGVFEHFPLS